ncbi:MAG: sulfotransferase [Terricaulis sp.]
MTTLNTPPLAAAAAARDLGDLWASVVHLRRSLRSEARLDEGWKAGILLARQIGDDFGAVALARRYCRDTRNAPASLFLLAEVLTEVGRAAEAVQLLSPIADALRPNDLFKFTRMLMFAGNIEEAHERARRLLPTHENSPTLWERLAQTKRFLPGDPDIDAMRAVFERSSLSKPEGRAAIASALGKAFVDLGDDRAANLFLTARAEAARVRIPFNRGVFDATLRDIVEWCNTGAPEGPSANVAGSARPIFVLGPNRSGTTLVDQILSRHPVIDSGGERRQFWLVSSVLGDCRSAPIDAFLARSRTHRPNVNPWEEIGRRYLDLADEGGVHGARFTDKLLSNVYRIRAIRQSLPDAKIVYVERSPSAVAWSCWRAQFDAESPWSNTAEGIAVYIATYRRAMEAWVRRYPEAIVTVAYEDIVRDPEIEIGRLLSACDLPDHPATRDPHLSTRAVTTLSFSEIRQPIHSRSVDAASAFPLSTKPLRDALDAMGLEG